LGWAAYFEGDLAASAEIFERVRQVSEAVGYRLGMASALGLLGHVAIDRADLTEARHHLCTCVRSLQVFGDSVGMLYGLEALARLAVAEGRYEVAVTLGGALTSLRGWVGARAFPPWERRLQGSMDKAQTTLGPELAHAAWVRGEAMSASATLTYALLEECLETPNRESVR